MVPCSSHDTLFPSRFRDIDINKMEVVGGFMCPVHETYGKKGLAPPQDRVEMVRIGYLQFSTRAHVHGKEEKSNAMCIDIT